MNLDVHSTPCIMLEPWGKRGKGSARGVCVWGLYILTHWAHIKLLKIEVVTQELH